MDVTFKNADWSAIAAWIALAISIITPAVTTLLTNKHQLDLHNLSIKEKREDDYNAARISAIEIFISSISKYISHPSGINQAEYIEHFFHIYAYVPQSLWPFLDDLHELLESGRLNDALALFKGISKSLACLLKEEPLILPSK